MASNWNDDLEALIRSRRKALDLTTDIIAAVLDGLTAGYPGDDPLSLIAKATPSAVSKATGYELDGDGAEKLIAAAKIERPQAVAPVADAQAAGNTSVDKMADAVRQMAEAQTANRPLEDRPLLELLEMAKVQRTAAVITAIRSKPEVEAAERKTKEWATLLSDKSLNIQITLDYINFLGKANSRVQRKYKGSRTNTLEAALGMMERDLVHPLTDSEALVENLDSMGFDWTVLVKNLDLYKSVVWARRTTHRL